MINTINTRLDTARALPIALAAKHGESLLLSVTLFNQGKALKLSENVTAALFYKDEHLADNHWYQSTDAVGINFDSDASIVNLIWSGKLDGGADHYAWFIRLSQDGSLSYCINGSIQLEESPGFTPNSIDLPVETIDFNVVKAINAPWATEESVDLIKKDVSALWEEVSGGASGGGLSAHITNFDNPHKITVAQLSEKSTNAGELTVVFNDSFQNLSGEFRFHFDPLMYQKGHIDFFLNVGENAPPLIAGKQLVYSGGVHLCELNASNTVFVTDTRIEGIYFYISIVDLISTTGTRLFFIISNDSNATDMKDVTPFGDAISNYISQYSYIQSGNYLVLTEKALRDTATGLAYTLSVTNGELHLTPYRITEFKA